MTASDILGMAHPFDPVGTLRATLAKALGLWIRTHYASAADAARHLLTPKTPVDTAWVVRCLLAGMFDASASAWWALDFGRRVTLADRDPIDLLFNVLRQRRITPPGFSSIFVDIKKQAQVVEAEALDYLPVQANLPSQSTKIQLYNCRGRRKRT